MENVLLVVHLLIAICLIAVVLLQRSEGGALGIGGGGGGGISSRGQATAMSKLTWALATCFIATSITLAILAGGDPAGRSVLDEVPGAGGSEIILPDLPPAAEDGAEGSGGGFALPDDGGSDGGANAPAPATPPTAD